MTQRASPTQVHVYLTADQRKRAVRCAGHLGEPLTALCRRSLLAFVDKFEREQEEAAALRLARKRSSFVPDTPIDWESPPKKCPAPFIPPVDPLLGAPVPSTAHVAGDVPPDDPSS